MEEHGKTTQGCPAVAETLIREYRVATARPPPVGGGRTVLERYSPKTGTPLVRPVRQTSRTDRYGYLVKTKTFTCVTNGKVSADAEKVITLRREMGREESSALGFIAYRY